MINSKTISAFRVPAMTTAAVACILLAIFGVVRLVLYSGPMLTENFQSAYKAPVGDVPLALYDFGLQAYKQEDYKLAKEALEESFKQLTRNTGVVPANRQSLAAKTHFLLGVVNEHLKQFRVAIEAYEESLRQDPTNLYAKYNLERLKSQYPDLGKGGGGGGEQDPNKDPSKGSQNNKKGI